MTDAMYNDFYQLRKQGASSCFLCDFSSHYLLQIRKRWLIFDRCEALSFHSWPNNNLAASITMATPLHHTPPREGKERKCRVWPLDGKLGEVHYTYFIIFFIKVNFLHSSIQKRMQIFAKLRKKLYAKRCKKHKCSFPMDVK